MELNRLLARLVHLELSGRVSEFDVCGEDVLTLKESIDLALRAAGRPRLSIAVPIRLALLGSSVLSTLTFNRSSALKDLDALLRSQLTDRLPARNDAKLLVDRMTPVFQGK